MDSTSSQRAMGSSYWLHAVSYSTICINIFRCQGLGRTTTNCRNVNFYPLRTALRSPSEPLWSSSVSTREPQVLDLRGSKASTPTREGPVEAWPKSCSLGPRNWVVGQRDPGSGRPPPLGCRGEGEGQVFCGFQWVAVVRALGPRKTQPNLSE